MNLSKSDWVIVAVIVGAGLLILSRVFFGGPKAPTQCLPVTLSPEVQAYIDSKLASNSSQSNSAQLADLEKQIADMSNQVKQGDDLQALKAQLESKSFQMQSGQGAAANANMDTSSALQAAREAEVVALQSAIANSCTPDQGAAEPRRYRGRVGENSGDDGFGGHRRRRERQYQQRFQQPQQFQQQPSPNYQAPSGSGEGKGKGKNSGDSDEPDI